MVKQEQKDKERKEDIQQKPDPGVGKDKRPQTPQPPQRKDPGAKPVSNEPEKKK